MRNRRSIRLNEEQFYRLIHESVKNVLSEVAPVAAVAPEIMGAVGAGTAGAGAAAGGEVAAAGGAEAASGGLTKMLQNPNTVKSLSKIGINAINQQQQNNNNGGQQGGNILQKIQGQVQNNLKNGLQFANQNHELVSKLAKQ